MKEKIILEYMKNYLNYFEKNIENMEVSLIFFLLRIRVEELEKLNEEQLKILNNTMKEQVEE